MNSVDWKNNKLNYVQILLPKNFTVRFFYLSDIEIFFAPNASHDRRQIQICFILFASTNMSVKTLIFIEIKQLQQTFNLLILPDKSYYMFNKTQNMKHETVQLLILRDGVNITS